MKILVVEDERKIADLVRKALEASGLGLSLSREIARAHGGDLTLATDDPSRTTLILSWPADNMG